MRYHLRPAKESDFEFVFRLNERNFREYVEQGRGWDEAAERREMKHLFRAGVDEIVVVRGADVGVLGVDRDESGIFLRHVELSAEVRGAGLGTALVCALIGEARAANVPLRLKVTKTNRARFPYERLGFRTTGEAGSKCLMSL